MIPPTAPVHSIFAVSLSNSLSVAAIIAAPVIVLPSAAPAVGDVWCLRIPSATVSVVTADMTRIVPSAAIPCTSLSIALVSELGVRKVNLNKAERNDLLVIAAALTLNANSNIWSITSNSYPIYGGEDLIDFNVRHW